MKKNEKINSIQYRININNIKRNISKESKKKKKTNSSMKIKGFSPILNLVYTGSGLSKGKNKNNNYLNNKNSENYEYILHKLLGYLKEKMSNAQYENTKIFLKKEIINLIKNDEIYNKDNKNDSISMILNSLSNNNPHLKIDKNIIESNILFTGNNSKNSSSLNKKKIKKNSRKINDKRLKLSYDFSNIISSNKTTVLEYKNNKKQEKKIINPFAKHKKFSLKPITTRDLHSLYSIIKHPFKKNENKKNKKYLNQTQSNSKSKSKNDSTSREYSTHYNSNTFFKNLTYTNRSENLGKINSHNSRFFHNFTLSRVKDDKNNKIMKNNNKKITNLKPTQNNKSILNEKLFSKIGNMTAPKKKLLINCNNLSNSINITKFFKTYENKKKINKTVTQTNSNSSSRIKSYRNKNQNFLNSKRPFSNKPIQSNIIKNLYGSIKNNTPNKNEEMIKQIKNTIDDSLRVMFNFSYENFLSKESEHESKDLSRENDLTFPYKYNYK